MAGAVAGGIIGQVMPVQLEGIDFCMTALFVTIFIDQWRSKKTHIPAVAGLVAVLIVHCLKDVPLDYAGVGKNKLIAVAVCAGLHLWKKNTLLSIIGSTAVYMILVVVCP